MKVKAIGHIDHWWDYIHSKLEGHCLNQNSFWNNQTFIIFMISICEVNVINMWCISCLRQSPCQVWWWWLPTVSEESLARDTHTHTHRQTQSWFSSLKFAKSLMLQTKKQKYSAIANHLEYWIPIWSQSDHAPTRPNVLQTNRVLTPHTSWWTCCLQVLLPAQTVPWLKKRTFIFHHHLPLSACTIHFNIGKVY